MKRLVTIAGLVLAFACQSFPSDRTALARVTVYWPSEGSGRAAAWNGARLRETDCAVDPKKIPYGSRVVLPDGSALSAVDTGSAVRNRNAARRSGRTSPERNAVVIDKFFETKRQALAWANSNPPFVSVKVVPPGPPAVATPNITNSQPIALSSAPATMTNAAPVISTGAIAATTNASVASPTGAIVRNPLGRLGR